MNANNSKILTSAEFIVKQHREEMIRRKELRDAGNSRPRLRSASYGGQALREPSLPAAQQAVPEQSHPIISPPPRPFFISEVRSQESEVRRIFRAINWWSVGDYLCWGALVAAIVAITGIFVFGPTSFKGFFR